MKNRNHLFLLLLIAVTLLSTAVYYKFIKVYLTEIGISEGTAGLNESRNLTLAENIDFLKSLQKTWAENGIEADDASQQAILRLRIINVLSSIGIVISLFFFGWLLMKLFKRSRYLAASGRL